MDQENQRKGSFAGAESKSSENQQGKVNAWELIVRILALSLTLIAAIILGVDKQTKVVPLKVLPTLPPVDVSVTAKSHYLSAFVYCMVSNAMACSYAALSSLLLITNRGRNKGLVLMILVADLLMVALLFSSTGAAGAIGLIGYLGNSHVQWNKVCNVFGKFCGQIAAALTLSLFGSIAFLLLVVIAALSLHKKSK